MVYESQQPRRYDPAFQVIAAVSRSWATNGNTDTVTDAAVTPQCQVNIEPTSQPAGTWWSVVTQGQFVVHSTDAETAGTTYTYRVL